MKPERASNSKDSEEEHCWVVRREGDVLAVELRRWLPRQAAAGGTNQLDGALVDATFNREKGKQTTEKRTSCGLSDTRNFNGIRIILLILSSSMPHFHAIRNLQVRQKPQHQNHYGRSRTTSSK